MKKIITSCALLLISLIVYSQNYLMQSFDSTSFPPFGWSDTIGSGTYNWIQTSSGSSPSCSPNSGSGMAEYQSFSASTGSNASLITPPLNFSIYSTGINVVSFWMYRDDGYASNTDQVSIYINTLPTITGGTLLGVINRSRLLSPAISLNGWYQYTFTIPPSYGSATNYIIFYAVSVNGNNMFIDDVSIDHLVPCTGTPAVPTVAPSGTLSACPGSIQTLNASVALASGVSFQWQISADAGISWTDIAGATKLTYSFAVTRNVQYRFKETCVSSSLSSVSDPVTISPTSTIVYAKLPYTQDFELWMNGCDNLDIPGSSWTSNPSSGNNSWRRDDEGQSNGSWSSNSGAYTPSATLGKHSARFHSFNTTNGSAGEIDLYLDCSAKHGIKQLNFDYINVDGTDSLHVSLSTDNGNTFSDIGDFGATGSWLTSLLPIVSDSPFTIIRFNAVSDYGSTDIGLDNIQILPPCQDKPIAGIIKNKAVCAGKSFTLSLVGSSFVAGLIYTWQQSTDGMSWTTLYVGSSNTTTDNIITATYFRAIVTCKNSGFSDTTPVQLIQILPFYNCYCDPTTFASSISGPNSSVGNFSILQLPAVDSILNDGNDNPLLECDTTARSGLLYINNDTLINNTTKLPILYRDSLYQLNVIVNTNQCSSFPGNTPVNIYLDLNHDGQFDNSELIFNHNIANVFSSPKLTDATVTDTFHMPDTAMVGITGLRVMSGAGQSSPISPCGETYYDNQVIDYLVNIAYQPCNGWAKAGTATISDTIMCKGYSYTLTDTTHESLRSKLKWIWQTSPDGITWGDIVGTDMKDIIMQTYNFPVWHRLKMICEGAHDTTYSNAVHIFTAHIDACYCYSAANGEEKDSCDIGAFSIGAFTLIKAKGPHLLNPAAVKEHTSYIETPLDLYTDSTYNISVYQIEKTENSAAAKITMFIDFNHNHTYDIPEERIWTGFTTTTDWHLSTNFTIPHTAVTGTVTGMRIILNNNTNANSASDNGCGAYTSGETLDFTVKLHESSPIAIGTINSMKELFVYPNPTADKATIEFISHSIIKECQIQVFNMTGQQILRRVYNNVTGSFFETLDFSALPKGVYMLELMGDGEKIIRKLIIK